MLESIKNIPRETEVAIVGGGPVGLALGCLLTLRRIECVVLERRQVPVLHSRAIGIHPPALAVLQKIGVADALIAHGVQITGGQVFYNRKRLGRVSLDSIGGAYPFALSIPQTVTEQVLERRLCEIAPNALLRGVHVIGRHTRDDGEYLRIQGVNGGEARLKAQYIVACDGKESTLRTAAGIPFHGGKYPDCYLMGDFADNTPFGSDAALFVTSGGIVESFPLPNQMRRWVARLPERSATNDSQELAAIIQARTGFSIPVETCIWTSAFGIEHYMASNFYADKLFLAGDAAHIVSPIGGQGMNLGFLDADSLADNLPQMQHLSTSADRFAHSRYTHQRQQAVKIALRRAELNTHLGRPCSPWHPHRAVVWAIVNIPAVRNHFARVLTMQGM